MGVVCLPTQVLYLIALAPLNMHALSVIRSMMMMTMTMLCDLLHFIMYFLLALHTFFPFVISILTD